MRANKTDMSGSPKTYITIFMPFSRNFYPHLDVL